MVHYYPQYSTPYLVPQQVPPPPNIIKNHNSIVSDYSDMMHDPQSIFPLPLFFTIFCNYNLIIILIIEHHHSSLKIQIMFVDPSQNKSLKISDDVC